MYKFKNSLKENIWKTHPSYKKNNDFQRYEFLGDKILAYTMAQILFDIYPDKNEGELTLMLSELVKGQFLAKMACVVQEEILHTGPLNDSVLSDCFEAWIAAVFLDGGDIKNIIFNLWKPYIYEEYNKNPKNLLQEMAQSLNRRLNYIFEQKENKEFICKVNLKNQEGIGIAKSKGEASVIAAENLLQKLKELKDNKN
jgi:ribonuclease-3